MTLMSWAPESDMLREGVSDRIGRFFPTALKGGKLSVTPDGKGVTLSLVWERQGWPLAGGESGPQWRQWFAQRDIASWEETMAVIATEEEAAIATSPEPGEVLVTACSCTCGNYVLMAIAATPGHRFAGIIPGRTHSRLLFLLPCGGKRGIQRGGDALAGAAREAASLFKQQVVERYPLLASAIIV